MDQSSTNGSLVIIGPGFTLEGQLQFNRLIWKRYDESCPPFIFPVIDSFWFINGWLIEHFYECEMTETTPEVAEDFYEQLYIELEVATMDAMKKMRLVHAVPFQQSLFLGVEAKSKTLYSLFPQLEVW